MEGHQLAKLAGEARMIADLPGPIEEAAMKFANWLRSFRRGGAIEGVIAGVAAATPLPKADVARFALECLSVAPGSAVESGALHMAYCAHAAKNGLSALPRGEFEIAWATFCKATGLKIVKHGTRFHVEGVALAA